MMTFDTLRRLALSLLTCLTLAACGAKVDIMASIAESDANEVIAALANVGITVTKVAGKDGVVGIQVAQKDTARAIDTLRQLGLPRESFTGMGQVFQKSGLISSPLEERARYLYALSQDLSATLTRIDGVLFARVHLVLPEKGSALDKDSPSSAAVFIKHRQQFDLEMLQPQVRRMVVNSIPGLTAERVSIVLIPSAVDASANKAPAMSSVWGMSVSSDAATSLTAVLWGLVAALLLALLGAAALAWRLKGRPAAEQAPSEAQA
jgi:type III secretion protein J